MKLDNELYEEAEIIEAFKLCFILAELKRKLKHVHCTISDISKSIPSVVAVKNGDIELSYIELESKSNCIANFLIAQGISNETSVAVYLEESVLLPICILGIIKSGGTYVPISFDSPPNRAINIFNDAGVALIFSDIGKGNVFSSEKRNIVEIDVSLSNIGNQSTVPPDIQIADKHAAYILYTSGSTGEPKGVIVEHGSLAHYLDWYLQDLQSKTQVNLPLTSSICFAAAITQMFSPLMLGETLHIIKRDIVIQPALLLHWYRQHPGYGLYCVPTLWEEIINYVEENNVPHMGKPDCIYLSGESLSKTLVDRTFNIWPDIQFWNLYGPTEATANISIYKVERGKEVYLGTSIRGGNIFLLDENMNYVPIGHEGIIYISSLSLARGYLNKPELNQNNFIVKHSIPGFEGVTIYNTGDIGKYNEKKELIYLGRKDQQVKIRGYRIELSEIEKSLNSFKEIRQAACKVITDSSGNKKIAAFLVCRNKIIPVNSIRNYLSVWLPEYMIPEIFSFLDYMPKLENNKIDRNRLNVDTTIRPELVYSMQRPETEEEIKLLKIWEEVLELDQLGMKDDFFDLGGNSIKMVKLVNLIKSRFNKTLTFEEIWKKSNPASLIELLANKSVESNISNHINESGKKKSVPLSFGQKGLWSILQSRPDQTAYNMLFSIELAGPLSYDIVQKVLLIILKKHDLLRSNFIIENRMPVRIIQDDPILSIEYCNISAGIHQAKTAFEHDLRDQLFNHPFDLSTDSLIQFRFVKYATNEYKLFVHVHHLIFDGMSINIFTADFLRSYNAINKNKKCIKNELLPLENTYSDYQQWLKTEYFNGNFSRLYLFWKDKLDGSNYFLNFPTDNVRPKIQSFKGKSKVMVIRSNKFEQLKAFNRSKKITPFIFLLSAFKTLIYRYTNETDILIGVPFANRANQETQAIIGYFVNTVVYRTKFDERMSFQDLLDNIKKYTSEALINQHYPFEKLVEKLNPKRSLSYNPIFQIMFAYHEKLESYKTLSGLHLKTEEFQNPNCKFDMDVEAQENENDISINVNYNSDLFDDETIDGFIVHYSYLLDQILVNPNALLSDYLLDEKAGLEKKVAKWNDTTAKIEDCCIHEIFERQAAATPCKISVSSGDQTLTYKELNEKSNQVAWALRKKNVTTDAIVCIMLDRSLDLMIGVFGVLKSGAAYLPIDTEYPQDRIDFILADSGASVLITKNKYKRHIEFSGEVICIDDGEVYANLHKNNPPLIGNSSNLAYLIYTSGSTGKPKGVMIEHRSVVNRIAWMQKKYPLDYTDIVLQKTAFTFDVSVWELLLWSFAGCSLHLLEPGGEKDPELILNTIRKKKISTLHFVPSMFNVFLEYLNDREVPVGEFSTLKYVFTSGETLEKHHVERFQSLISPSNEIQLINLYGPTEATVDVSYFDCKEATNYKKVPIGKPIDNIQLYVLDKNNNLLPEKIPGELCIGGVGLARGYLNNTILTDEKYITSSFNGARLYKTGDLAKWLSDGNIEYLGRIDQQVKIRGFRIELGEIGSCMNKHTNVEASVAITKKFGHDDTRIVAYYILKNKAEHIDFKAYLRARLPEYMIPFNFIAVDSIPFLSNGKLDVKALPEPVNGTKKVMWQGENNNAYETRLAAIWSNVLKTDEFDADDNFYDVGGHSLLLIKMKYLIDSEFEIDISIVDLFQYPSIKMLAKVIASAGISEIKSAIEGRATSQKRALFNITKRL